MADKNGTCERCDAKKAGLYREEYLQSLCNICYSIAKQELKYLRRLRNERAYKPA